MSNVIDENVVELRFDNAQFEKGVRESMQSIERLEDTLNIEKGAENFKVQFSGMQIVAATIISEITKSAINLGKNLNNMIFGQIKSGGFSRASNIEAAKFMLEGLGVTWKEIEEDINYGVADTAYGLDAAAKAASQLVASGVRFGQESEQMKNTLRGISGVAAMTNSTYEDTAAIFTTIAGQGRVMTMQLRQLEARGLNVAATMGQQLGKTEAEIRDMVTKGQIDFNTFAESMDRAFGSHAKDANKTLTGVLSNIRSALSKIGADFFTPIIQNEGPLVNMLDQIRLFLNLVRKYIQPATERLASYVNLIITNLTKFFHSNLISDWIDPIEGKTTRLSKKVTDFIDSIKRKTRQMANTVLSYVIPIIDAFKAVFGGSIIKSATSFNDTITMILKSVQLSSKGMQGLAKTFYGIFTVIKLVRNIFVMFVKALIPATQKCQGFLDIIFTLTGYVGDIVSKFAAWIYNTKILQTIIYTLGTACRGVANVIILVASAIEKIFSSIVNSKLAATMMKVLSIVLKVMINTFNEGLYYITKFVEHLSIIPRLIQAIVDKFVSAFNQAGDKISLFSIMELIFKTLSKVFIFLLKSFKYLVTNLDQIPSKLREIGRAIRDALSQFEAFKIAFSILDILVGYLTKMATKIKEFVSALSSTEIKDFSLALSWLIVAVSASRASRGFTKLTKSITSFVNGIKKAFFGEAVSDKPLDEVLKLVDAIAILVACAKILSTIPTDRLREVVEAIGFVMETISLMYLIVALVDHLCNTLTGVKRDLSQGFKVTTIAALFLALSVSLKTLGDSIIQMEGIKWGTILEGMSKIIIVTSAIGFVATILTHLDSKDLKKGFIGAALSIAAMGYASKQIAESLVAMSNMDANKIEKAGYALLAAGTAMGALAAGISNLGLGNVLAFYIFIKTFNKALPEVQALSDNLLSKINAQKIIDQLEQYRVLAGVIAGVLIAFTYIVGKYEVGKQFQKFASSFIIIDIALLLMVQVCKSINKNADEIERAIPALSYFIGCLAILEGLAIFTVNSKFKEFAKSLGSIVIAVTILSALAYSLSELTDDTNKLLKAAGAVAIMSSIFGVMMYCSSEARKVKIAPLLTMTAMIGVLAGTLSLLTYATSYGDVESAIESMISVMVVLGALMTYLSREKVFKSFKENQIRALLVFIGVIVSIGGMLALIAVLKPDSIVAAAVALSSAMIAFAGAIKIINNIKYTEKQGLAVIKLAEAMFLIGLALAGLSLIDWQRLIPSLVSMSAVMIAFGFAIKIMGKTDVKFVKESENVIKLAGAMFVIASAMSLLSHFDWSKIISSGTSMSAAMLSFSLVLKYIGNIKSVSWKEIAKLIPVIGMMATLGIGLLFYQKAVANLDYKMIAASAIGLAAVVSSMALCINIASNFNAEKGNAGFAGMANAIVGLGVIATVLWAYQTAVKNIEPSILVASFAGLTTVFAAYAGMQYALSLIAKAESKVDAGQVAGLLFASLINLVFVAGALIFYQNAVKDIKPSVLVASFAGMATVIGAFSGMMLAMSKIQNGGFKKNLGTIAVIATICGGLVVAGYGLKTLADIPWKSLIAPLAAMELTLGSVAAMLWFISNKVNIINWQSILGLGLALGAIYLATDSLKKLTDLPFGKMLSSVAMLYVLMGAISSLMSSINTIQVTATNDWFALGKQLMSLASTCIILGVVCAILKDLSSMPWEEMLTTSVSLYLVLTSLAKMTSVANTFDFKGILGFAVSLGILGAALSILSLFDWFEIMMSAGSLSLTMLALAGVVSIISADKFKLRPTQATSIVKIAAAIGIMGAALSLLAHFNWASILAACGGMSVAMIAFSFAMAIMSGLQVKVTPKQSETLIKISLTMVALSASLALLSNYSFESIVGAVGGLVSALLIFAVAIGLLNKIDLSHLSFAKVNFGKIIKYTVGFIAFAGMLVILSKELTEVAKADWTSIIGSLGLAAISMGILLGIGALLSKAGPISAVALGALAIALLAVGASMIPLANNMDKLAQSMLTIKMVGVGEIVRDIYELKTSLDYLSTSNNSIAVITDMFAQLANALNNADLTLIVQSFTDISNNIHELMYDNMYDAGKDAIAGFVEGIKDNIGMAASIMTYFGSTVINAFRAITGWHSPWAILVDAGRDAILGLNKGINDNTPAAQKTGAIFGFKSGLSIAEGLATADGAVREAIQGIRRTIESEEGDIEVGIDVKDEDALNNLKAIDQASKIIFGKSFEELSDEQQKYIGYISAAREEYSKLYTEYVDNSGDFGEIARQWDIDRQMAELRKQVGENNHILDEEAREAALNYLQAFSDEFAVYNTGANVDAITEVYDKLGEDGASHFANGIKNGLTKNQDAVNEGNKVYTELLDDTITSAENISNTTSNMFQSAKEAAGDFLGIDVSGSNYMSSFEDLIGSYSDFSYALEDSTSESDLLHHQLVRLGLEEETVAEKTQTLQERYDELARHAVYLANAIRVASSYGGAAAAGKVEEWEQQYQDVVAQMEEVRNQQDALNGSATSDAMSEAASKTDKYADSMDNLRDSINDALSSNERFDRSVTDSSKTIINNLKSQVRGTTEWANDLVRLASRGASQTLIEELGEMGTEGYSMLESYLSMTDEQLAEVNDIYDNRATLDKQVLARVNASYALAGNQNAVAYLKTLGYSLEQAKQLVEESAEEANKEFNENLSKFAEAEPYTDEYNELKLYFQELGYTTKDVAAMVEQANGNIAVSLRNLEMEEAFKKIETAYYSMYSIVVNSSDPFSEFSRSFEVSKKDLFKNLNSQVAGFAEWSNKLIILANRGVSRGILGALEEAGPESVDKIDAMLDMTSEELEKYTELWENSESNIEDTSRSMMMALAISGDEDAIAYFESLGMSIDDVKAKATELDAQTMHLTNMKNAAKAVQEEFTGLYDTIKGQIDIFEEFDTSAELSGDELLENMQSQVEGIKEWSKNISELAGRGMSEGLLKELSDLGPDGYEKVAAFIDMTDDQIREANDLYAESLTLPLSATGEVMSSYAKAGDQAAADFINSLGVSASNAEAVGKAFVDAFSEGITNELDLAKLSGSELMEGFMVGLDEMGITVNDTAATLSTNLLDSMRATLGIHSPSTETTAMGKHLCEGFNKGMNDHTKGVVNTAIDMGKNIVNGLMNGINTQVNSAYSSITSFANKILDTAKRVLGINSPSRKFAEIGMYSVMGMCEGIKNYAYMATDAANDLSEDTINVVQDAIKSILDIINSDDEGFVIRPILDLSNIQEGANKISSMFKQKELAMAFDADDAINQNGGKVNAGGSIVFNQYNTSPKALDRIEIYRQTKNQFSQLRGMVTT